MAAWRKIPHTFRWRVFKETDRYLLQRRQELWVNFDSGKEEWRDEQEGFHGDYVEQIVPRSTFTPHSTSIGV